MRYIFVGLLTVSFIAEIGSSRAHSSAEALAKLPLIFEPRQGEPAQFISRGRGYTMLFSQKGASMRLRRPTGESAEVRMRLKNANAAPFAAGEDKLPGVS